MSDRHLTTIYASAPRGARTSHPGGHTCTIGGWESQPKEGLIPYTRADYRDALTCDVALLEGRVASLTEALRSVWLEYDPSEASANARDMFDIAAEALEGLKDHFPEIMRDADRYRWLRERDLDTIDKGGVFVGRTPDNVVLNGDDLDRAVDWGMS